MRFAITSVNYADFLAVTLPAWKTLVPGVFVATSPEDTDTQDVAAEHGVQCVMTDAWTRVDPSCHEGGPATFNIALGLDEVLGLSGYLVPRPFDGELVGHASADCVPFGMFPKDARFDFDTVYAFWRYECLQQKHLEQHRRGVRPLTAFKKLKNSGGGPIGYCQIFRSKPGRRFGSYPTAGKFDTHFTARFLGKQMLEDMYFLHLGPIDVKSNWAGRTVPQWGAA